jgi:hypothetical protein
MKFASGFMETIVMTTISDYGSATIFDIGIDPDLVALRRVLAARPFTDLNPKAWRPRSG